MFVAPGPIELVQAIMRRRRLALGKRDRRQAHRLLVMRAQRRQPLACAVQRLAEAGDIAMPENRKDTGKQRNLATIDFARLRGEIASERLRHCEPDRGHCPCLPFCFW